MGYFIFEVAGCDNPAFFVSDYLLFAQQIKSIILFVGGESKCRKADLNYLTV